MAETTINSGETPVPATPPSVPPRKPRWKSWLKTCLYSLLALFIIIVALLCWLIGTESGLRFGVHTVPKWFGVHIQTKNLTGSIWHGFSGTDIHVSHRGFDLSIDKVRLDWNNRELWRRRFHVRLLDVGKINYTDHSVPKPKPVPTLPNSISLPLQVIIDNIQLGGFTLGKKETPVLLASQASYTFDYHKHQLILSELNTPWQSIHGNAAITTQTPFILSGQLNGSGTLDKTAVESAALIKGKIGRAHV